METLARPSTFWDSKPSLKSCLRLQFLPIAELSSAKGLVNDWANVNKLDSPCQRPPGQFAVTEGVVTRGHHGTGDFPVEGTGREGAFGVGRLRASDVFAVPWRSTGDAGLARLLVRKRVS